MGIESEKCISRKIVVNNSYYYLSKLRLNVVLWVDKEMIEVKVLPKYCKRR